MKHSDLAVKTEQGSDCASVSSRGKYNYSFTTLTIGIPAFNYPSKLCIILRSQATKAEVVFD